jgi:hypothetical protein
MRCRRPLGRPLLLASALAIVAACADGPRDFPRPQPPDLVLGTTTPADVTARFGEPQRRGRLEKDGVDVTSFSYSYADPAAATATAGVPAVKAMALYFARGTLVGYEFLSTFRADSSDFDDTRISDIARGITTEAQVRGLVGRPSGMYIYPLTGRPGERALVFLYGEKRGRAPLAQKQLIVTLDASGIVRDVQFEKTGAWE